MCQNNNCYNITVNIDCNNEIHVSKDIVLFLYMLPERLVGKK